MKAALIGFAALVLVLSVASRPLAAQRVQTSADRTDRGVELYGQRWFEDVAEASRRARSRGRCILYLRMLGDLAGKT